jgi:hypothetical protein
MVLPPHLLRGDEKAPPLAGSRARRGSHEKAARPFGRMAGRPEAPRDRGPASGHQRGALEPERVTQWNTMNGWTAVTTILGLFGGTIFGRAVFGSSEMSTVCGAIGLILGLCGGMPRKSKLE